MPDWFHGLDAKLKGISSYGVFDSTFCAEITGGRDEEGGRKETLLKRMREGKGSG